MAFNEKYNTDLKTINSLIDEDKINGKDEALEKFLLSLNNATDYSCTVSKHFDFSDLLTIKYLMKTQDTEKLLKLAHMRNWPHVEKWNSLCPVCCANEELSIKATI